MKYRGFIAEIKRHNFNGLYWDKEVYEVKFQHGKYKEMVGGFYQIPKGYDDLQVIDILFGCAVDKPHEINRQLLKQAIDRYCDTRMAYLKLRIKSLKESEGKKWHVDLIK